MLTKSILFYVAITLEAFVFCFAGEYLSAKVNTHYLCKLYFICKNSLLFLRAVLALGEELRCVLRLISLAMCWLSTNLFSLRLISCTCYFVMREYPRTTVRHRCLRRIKLWLLFRANRLGTPPTNPSGTRWRPNNVELSYSWLWGHKRDWLSRLGKW